MFQGFLTRVRFLRGPDEAVVMRTSIGMKYALPIFVYDDPLVGASGNIEILLGSVGGTNVKSQVLQWLVKMWATEEMHDALVCRDVMVRRDAPVDDSTIPVVTIDWYGKRGYPLLLDVPDEKTIREEALNDE